MKESTLKKHKLVIDEWLVNGRNGTQAYLSVYPKVDENTAGSSFKRLLRNDKIQEYLENKEKALQKKHNITLESLIEDLQRGKEIALADEKIPAYAKCVELQAKLLGMFEKHNEQKNKVIKYKEVLTDADNNTDKETKPSNTGS